MRPVTSIMAQLRAETKTGTVLVFENCKGGYFSTDKAYGITVTGAGVQNGTPTPENAVTPQFVPQGTKITSAGESSGGGFLTTPCQLCPGDVWYPGGGYLEKYFLSVDLGTLTWYYITTDGDGREYFNAVFNDIYSENNAQAAGHIMCDRYDVKSTFIVESGLSNYCIATYLRRIRVRDARYTNAAAFKAAVAGTTMWYKADAPIRVNYPAQNIAAVAGTCSVTSDSTVAPTLTATHPVRR